MGETTGPKQETTSPATTATRGDLSGEAMAPAEATPSNGAADFESRFAALSEQVASLTGSLDEARKAEAAATASIEASKVAAERDKMTTAQRHDADVSELRLQLQVMTDRDQATTRAAALDRLGVLEAYRGFAPKVDASTDDGRATLEAWAKSHPEIVSSPASPTQTAALMSDALSDIVAKNRWIKPGSIRDSMQQAAALDSKMSTGR